MQTLLFSDKEEAPKPVNVASVPQRSPFRYPGGKTWFVPRLREWLKSKSNKPKLLIEPFAGGGIISLTAVFENLAEKALMTEIDQEIAAVWQCIMEGDAEWLAKKILTFEMTKENAIEAIKTNKRSTREKAFQTILKNRTFHGGILANGSGFIKNGEKGKGVLSRWYPATLAKRLRHIDQVKGKLNFQCDDGLNIIEQYIKEKNVVFFIDPPYTAGGKKAGKRLYTHFDLDHQTLFRLCSKIQGDFVMTYDNAEEVKDMAFQYNFQAKPIAMKSTHHAAMTELVVGKNLEWMRGIGRVLEEGNSYNVKKTYNARSE